MTRMLAVLVALAVLGCGGSDSDPASSYSYTVDMCGSCTTQQLGRCIDMPLQVGQPAVDGFTCKGDAGWTSPMGLTPCAPADCRMVGSPPTDGSCNIRVECPRPL